MARYGTGRFHSRSTQCASARCAEDRLEDQFDVGTIGFIGQDLRIRTKDGIITNQSWENYAG